MGKLRCQLCGSTNIEKKVEQKFSVGKGILGTLFFGSGGAVAGVNGKTEEYYYCNACCRRTIPLMGIISDRIDELLENPKNHKEELLELVKKYYNIEYNPVSSFENDTPSISYSDSALWGETIMEVLKSYNHESFTTKEFFNKIEEEKVNIPYKDINGIFYHFKRYPSYIISETKEGTRYYKVSDNWNLDDYYFTYEKEEKVYKFQLHRFNRRKIENNGIDFLKDIINNAEITDYFVLKEYLVLEWNIEEDKLDNILLHLENVGILNEDHKPNNKEKISEYILNNELEIIKANGKDIIKNSTEFLTDFIDIIKSNPKAHIHINIFPKLAEKWCISRNEIWNIYVTLGIFDICDYNFNEREWKIINLDNIKDCYIDENKNLVRKNDNRKEITSSNSYDFFKTIEEYVNLNVNFSMFKFVGKKWLINYKDFENIQQKLENAGILVCDSDNYKWNIYMDKLDDYYIDTDKKLKKGQKANLGIADEIKKYKELLDSGAITQEEYDKKKKELLAL